MTHPSMLPTVAAIALATLAVLVAFEAHRNLQRYAQAIEVTHAAKVALAKRVSRWRVCAHAAAFLVTLPLAPLMNDTIDTLATRLAAAFGATAIGSVAVFLGKKVSGESIRHSFAADVSVWNQVKLAAMGLMVVGAATLVYFVIHEPEAVRESIRVLLDLPKPDGH